MTRIRTLFDCILAALAIWMALAYFVANPRCERGDAFWCGFKIYFTVGGRTP